MGKEGIGFEPTQSDVEQKEVEKKPKKIIVDVEGHVEGAGLDDIDTYLFSSTVVDSQYHKNPFTHLLCDHLARRLGYDYSESDKPIEEESTINGDRTAFAWTDDRKGAPQYEKTPNPETENIVRFYKNKIELTMNNFDRWKWHVRGSYSEVRNNFDEITNELQERNGPFYEYSFEGSNLPVQDRELINFFLLHVQLQPRSNIDAKWILERYEAAQEIAKRLGYKVEIEE